MTIREISDIIVSTKFGKENRSIKRALILLLIISTFIFTGCTDKPSHKDEILSSYEAYTSIMDAIELFENSRTYRNGKLVYPDNYAGYYVDGVAWFFLVTDLDQVSEYQYLKEAYPDIEFKEAEYSYNYLQNLIDEYESSPEAGGDVRYRSYVDVRINRAVIEVDEETLAKKQFDENSPLIFKSESHLVFL